MKGINTGTAVCFTKSKLEMFATPATAIITVLIGLKNRPTEAAFCIPNSIVIALPPNSLAKFGTNGEKANIDATPEPITMLNTRIITDTITPTISAWIEKVLMNATNSLTIPNDVKPNAKVSPATIKLCKSPISTYNVRYFNFIVYTYNIIYILRIGLYSEKLVL